MEDHNRKLVTIHNIIMINTIGSKHILNDNKNRYKAHIRISLNITNKRMEGELSSIRFLKKIIQKLKAPRNKNNIDQHLIT